MRIITNPNLLTKDFLATAMGYVPKGEIDFLEITSASSHRLGQFISAFNYLCLRTSSNILSIRQDAFEPATLKDLQKATKLQDRAFWNFTRDTEQGGLIKVSNGIIYVNPLFSISPEMDYIREDIIVRFPDYKSQLESLNKILNRTINEEL